MHSASVEQSTGKVVCLLSEDVPVATGPVYQVDLCVYFPKCLEHHPLLFVRNSGGLMRICAHIDVFGCPFVDILAWCRWWDVPDKVLANLRWWQLPLQKYMELDCFDPRCMCGGSLGICYKSVTILCLCDDGWPRPRNPRVSPARYPNP